MKKDRLARFRKKLEEKQRQLVEEVGRNVMYGTARGRLDQGPRGSGELGV